MHLTKLTEIGTLATVLEYWKILLSSTNFAEYSLVKCLDVTHEDIVVVWNVDDPYMVRLYCMLAKLFIDIYI